MLDATFLTVNSWFHSGNNGIHYGQSYLYATIITYNNGQLVISFRSKWNSLRSNFDRTVNLFHALCRNTSRWRFCRNTGRRNTGRPPFCRHWNRWRFCRNTSRRNTGRPRFCRNRVCWWSCWDRGHLFKWFSCKSSHSFEWIQHRWIVYKVHIHFWEWVTGEKMYWNCMVYYLLSQNSRFQRLFPNRSWLVGVRKGILSPKIRSNIPMDTCVPYGD